MVLLQSKPKSKSKGSLVLPTMIGFGSVLLSFLGIVNLHIFFRLPEPTTITKTTTTTTTTTIRNFSRSSSSSTLQKVLQASKVNRKKRNHKRTVVIDILSIGSLNQPEWQDAQEETFGRHETVRHFYRATELDDAEQNCHVHLTLSQVARIVGFCREQKNKPYLALVYLRQFYPGFASIKKKKNPTGWLCAQKRPLSALYNMFQKYYSINDWLPDYLLMVDDDTYVNMDLVSQHLPLAYPSHEAHAIAGCLLRFDAHTFNMTFPFGGYGLILTQRALVNLVQPILDCPSDSNLNNINATTNTSVVVQGMINKYQVNRAPDWYSGEFSTRMACWRLQQNLIGERDVFQNGQTLIRLMQAYATNRSFLTKRLKKHSTNSTPTFCLQSDWAVGYFLNFYHVGRHSLDPLWRHMGHDCLLPYNNTGTPSSSSSLSQYYMGSKRSPFYPGPAAGQCIHGIDFVHARGDWNGNRYCQTGREHFCHRISPFFMRNLFRMSKTISSNQNNNNKTSNNT